MKKALFILLGISVFLVSCTGGLKISSAKDTPTETFGERNFHWTILSDRDSTLQTAYKIDVALSQKDLDKPNRLVWTSGRTESGIVSYVPYGGPELQSDTRYYWRVTVWDNHGRSARSSSGNWISGLKDRDWQAQWIGVQDNDLTRDGKHPHYILPARYLRKEFTLDKPVKSAVLYICGLGNSECYLNGRKISDDIFGPLPTLFTTSVNYLTYDITGMVHRGNNAIGASLGMGRFSGPEYPHSLRNNTFFGLPCLIAEIHIEYRDDSKTVISTDTSWLATNKGPITNSNEYDGEFYDARMELGAWTKPGFIENENWRQADLMPAPGGRRRAQNAPCIKVGERLHPKEIRLTGDGRVIIDFGQNIAGRMNVSLNGRQGQPVVFRFSEILKKDDPDQLDVANLRLSRVEDRYIPAEDGRFSWAPIFTYHGFRYAEISGIDYLPEAEDIVAETLHDETVATGRFECSDELINKIYRNITWGTLDNWRGFPTDCPQRNEREGWIDDYVVQTYAQAYQFDNEYLYSKWMLDIEESQYDDGSYSVVSPRYWMRHTGDPSSSLTIFNGVDMLYRFYGNGQALKMRYESMRKWLDYVESNLLEDGIVAYDNYGDWCAPSEDPFRIHSADPKREVHPCVVSTAYIYREMVMMTEFARRCGFDGDAAHYEELAETIKESFNRHYYVKEGGYYGGEDFLKKAASYNSGNLISKTYPRESVGNEVANNVIALAFDLVPEEYRKDVSACIRRVTQERWHGHISVGNLGMRYFMRTLSRNGLEDLAFQIATNDTYPSWGYMIGKGATTIWELWNGDTADVSMNSHNHVMLAGDFAIWLFEDLAGIKPAAPGFGKIRFSLILPEGMNHVNASYTSVYGKIVSNWKKEGDKFFWHIEIPTGSTAEIEMPDGSVLQKGSGAFDLCCSLTNAAK